MSDIVSVSIGPVQDFIAAAKSVRDLWSGSMMLSWLSYQIALELEALGAEIISPYKGEDLLPFLPAWRGAPVKEGLNLATCACLPNTITAQFHSPPVNNLQERLQRLADGLLADAAQRVLDGVEDNLRYPSEMLAQVQGWLRVLVVRDNARGSFQERVSECARRMAATKATPHVPTYRWDLPSERVPQKCTLLGRYEQICRGEFALDGVHVRKAESLSGPALLKRFFPSLVFGEKLNQAGMPSDQRHRALHFDDISSIATRAWSVEELERGDIKYYAILLLDGDNMGKWLMGSMAQEIAGAEHGSEGFQREFSKCLARFAVEKVPAIVASHSGELVYSGGDDVLALLPLKTAIACAKEINLAFRSAFPDALMLDGVKAGASAGLAIVHIKEDLRWALGLARRAEAQAKAAGRDRIAICTSKRAGDTLITSCLWDHLEDLELFLEAFLRGATDNWVYDFRKEWVTLQGIPPEAIKCELRRLILRKKEAWQPLGKTKDEAAARVLAAASSFAESSEGTQAYREFVEAVHQMSFMARGRDR